MTLQALIAPSILSADFAVLAAESEKMIQLGADWLHCDVMDGHFVPNLTIGAPVIKSLRKHLPNAFLDCHLMVSNPDQWVNDFKAAGASQYTFHLEAVKPEQVGALIDKIHASGMKVGISIKPKTSVEALEPFADKIDNILIMTVEPGFGGQKFMEEMMPKVKHLRERFPQKNIQVDGGLDLQTIQAAAEAGANVIVAGSSIFGSNTPGEVINGLRAAVNNKLASSSS